MCDAFICNETLFLLFQCEVVVCGVCTSNRIKQMNLKWLISRQICLYFMISLFLLNKRARALSHTQRLYSYIFFGLLLYNNETDESAINLCVPFKVYIRPPQYYKSTKQNWQQRCNKQIKRNKRAPTKNESKLFSNIFHNKLFFVSQIIGLSKLNASVNFFLIFFLLLYFFRLQSFC